MPKIDPEELKQFAEGTVIQEIKTANGQTIGYKGRFIPDVFDNMTECLRENQNARRLMLHKELGLNEHAQTKEQEKDLKLRQAAAAKRREARLTAETIVSQNA